MRVSIDERELLEDILSQEDGMKVLWRLCDAIQGDFQRSVLNYDLSTGSVEKLSHLKLRAEGAAQFLSALRQRLSRAEGKKEPSSGRAKKRVHERVAT